MPRYGYVTCCGFQLCNVFRSHAMEIDQCLLDSLSPSQRQHLLKRLRSDQVRAYYEREKSSPARCRGQSEKKAAPKVRFHARDVLQDAVVRHDHKEVQRLLKDGADLNTAVPSGGSLLHLCARHDNTVVTELLINMGLNVDAQDEELWTALHVACACDSPETVLLLLAAGADLWLRDINGKVALDYATEGTETSYVLLKYLEEKGVDVNALWHPKKHRISDALSDVHQIVAAGENVHQSSGEGVTVTGIANQLLWQGTNPTPLDCDKEKPSDIAVLGCIADTLRRAEGCWEHRQETPSPSADTRCETLVPAMLTLNRKLYNLTFPIAKRDTLQEKGTMFPDQSVTRSASRPCAMISPLGMSVNKLEQLNISMNFTLSREANSAKTKTLAECDSQSSVTLMPPAPSDDLASLSELTDSSLLYEMQKRFGNDQIYTYIGHILLLVNPNKELPIYSTLVSQLYLSPSGRPSPSLPPHIFSSAERAFHTMLDERRPQCFVLSGESGSGKTVACQHIVQHLIARSGPVSLALDSRMQHANCVLEAFGHARTEMNNNSSRFIKFLSLQYSEKTLMSVKLYVYLLEKSRLVSPPPYQRNFNIFYLMAEGMSSEEKSSLCLTDVLAHRYLHQTGAGDAAAAGATHSTDKLLELKQALHALGFSDPEVENLFRILSAVLHVGDLAFASRSDAETVFVTDPCLLDQVSAMLQVSPQDLGSALTSDVKYLKGDAVAARHTVETANSYRDLLATALYSRIFSFLASCLGDYLQGQEGDSRSPDLEIGLLDIFGFEEFKKNGFEQLCVNMTNERIHQCIAEMLFKEEHLDCQQEGVAMETSYTLRDQSPALNFFFQEPDGLLSVLDLESRAPQPEEQHAFQKLQAHHISVGAGTVVTSAKDGNGNPPLENQGPIFSIRHYAGKTTYDLSGSVEKNKDSVPRSILFVMTSSENVLVRQLFRRKRARAGPLLPPRRCLEPGQTRISPARAVESKYRDISKLLKKGGSSSSSLLQRLERRGPVTLAVQMRSSLSEIADRLKSCTPHFIQCIKPNGSKRPDSFDSLHVSAQLQHVGVLEMVKMTRYGYPVRLPFVGFLTRFRDLAAAAPRSDGPCSAEEKCRHVLQQIKLQTGWQMGYNKVFLGYWQANQLDEQCHQLRRKIVICQKVVRGWLVRTRARPRARVRRREAGKVPGFLQATEDPGQPAHDGPVIQAAPGPLPRESGSLRKTTRSPAGKQEEAHARDPNKKVGDDGAERSRVLKNFCSSPVPLPPSVENLVHSAAGLSIKAPTQQTEGGGGGGSGLSSPRKQPPPKPKRDPNTRLSTSIDAVSASLSVCPQNTLADALSKPRPHSDDYSAVKKVPPPKPIRSPNTKLTGSFEEISVPRASEAMLSKTAQGPGASIDGPHCLYRSPEEESVYIEMAGHPRVTCVPKADALEPGEAVYEEMKYPKSDAGAGEAKVLQTASETSSPPPSAETNQVAPEQGSRGAQTYCKGGPSDVPSPFPNLLPHRPPLLAFPLPTVPYSSALDESPLTPLEVKKLPVLETNLNYSGQAEGGARQRSDSSSTPASIQDRLTPPVSPALGLPSPAKLPPPYKTHCHTPFSWETSVLVVTRGASGANSTKGCQKAFQGSSEAPPATGRPPFSPVKKSHPDSRQPHSCCSSPLLFNPSNARPLSSPLDELSTLISAGRSLLKKSANGRRTRESGFNSNINHPGRLDSGTTSPSPRLQDKNANNHPIGSPISVENGNQLSNVLLEDEDQSNIITSLHRHLDRHPNQRDHLNFSPFGTEATL